MLLLLLTRTERMWHTIPFNFGTEPTIYINVSSGSQPWIGCTMYIGELQLHTTTTTMTTTISYRVLAKLKYRKWTNKSGEKRKITCTKLCSNGKIHKNKMVSNISIYVSKFFIRQQMEKSCAQNVMPFRIEFEYENGEKSHNGFFVSWDVSWIHFGVACTTLHRMKLDESLFATSHKWQPILISSSFFGKIRKINASHFIHIFNVKKCQR